jgi:uncharacterized protein YjbI with pentapeptide repeats
MAAVRGSQIRYVRAMSRRTGGEPPPNRGAAARIRGTAAPNRNTARDALRKVRLPLAVDRPPTGGDRLRPDCARCFGLCCVAPAFSASADFAIDKPAGQPCPNLQASSRCAIHTELRPRGFAGCAVYDCFGAGQRISQLTFAGRDWRGAPGTARAMFDAFAVMRQLHELLWYLREAATLAVGRSLRTALRASQSATDRLTELPVSALLDLDLESHRRAVADLLLRASERVRLGPRTPRTARIQRRAPADHRGADLIGADLHSADLRAANLRGALLIGADLSSADLRLADLIGADLRGAQLHGADLRDALFLLQSQLDAALGDRTTRIPAALKLPAHW